jgi:hypothetical protein
MVEHVAACTCGTCGNILTDDRFDIRFGLPDAALAIPEADRATRVRQSRSFAQLATGDSFVRCLLLVRLTGDSVLGFGTWLRVSPDDFRRAKEIWNAPEYADLTLDGILANDILPWEGVLTAAPVRVVVRDPEELPYVVSSDDAAITGVFTDVWDRDLVLSCFSHGLPVTIREQLTDHWSVQRTAGFRALVRDGSKRFVGPGRTVIIDVYDLHDPTAPEDTLARCLTGAPPATATFREDDDGEVRYAFAVTSSRGPQYELYGHVIRPDSIVQITCIHDDPEHLDWALDVWRSVRFHA